MSYCSGDNCEYKDFHPGQKTYYFEEEKGNLYCLECAGEIEHKYGYVAKSDDDISNFEDEDED